MKRYKSYHVYEAWVGKQWVNGQCKFFAANSFDEAVALATRWASSLEYSPKLTKVKKLFDEVVYSFLGDDEE